MEKHRWEESEKRREKERRSKKRKPEKKEDAGVRKGRNVANHCVFPMVCGSGGSNSRLPKAAGAEPSGQMRMKSCTRSWREAHFELKLHKTHHAWSTFRSCDVEKVHAVVARSTFASEKAKNTSRSDTFRSCHVEKVHAVVARNTFRSQNV